MAQLLLGQLQQRVGLLELALRAQIGDLTRCVGCELRLRRVNRLPVLHGGRLNLVVLCLSNAAAVAARCGVERRIIQCPRLIHVRLVSLRLKFRCGVLHRPVQLVNALLCRVIDLIRALLFRGREPLVKQCFQIIGRIFDRLWVFRAHNGIIPAKALRRLVCINARRLIGSIGVHRVNNKRTAFCHNLIADAQSLRRTAV